MVCRKLERGPDTTRKTHLTAGQHSTIFNPWITNNVDILLYEQDFKRLLAQQTPREPRASAGHQLGVTSPPTTSQSVPTYRELQKSGSMKKMGTPWRFSIIQEEPERGRSEEELANKNMGPTDL